MTVSSEQDTADVREKGEPYLHIEDLAVHFRTEDGVVKAVDGISFDVAQGETLGIVGESGSGKSVTGMSILGLHDPDRSKISGQVIVDGVDVTGLSDNALRRMRGKAMAMIFQDALTALHPYFTIGKQIVESYRLHHNVSKDKAKRRAIEILDRVGIPEPLKRFKQYPHEFSGGMRQRAMIAMALSCEPALLIADEPTTALDVTTEAQILALMRRLKSEIGMSIMFITHSMGVVAQLCDEVIVMYLGRVVERASVDEIFYAPKHPYTRSLLRSIPRIGSSEHTQLETIKGSIPDPYVQVPGCTFHPRCPDFMAGVCDTVIPEETLLAGPTRHGVRCHLYDDEVGPETNSAAESEAEQTASTSSTEV